MMNHALFASFPFCALLASSELASLAFVSPLPLRSRHHRPHRHSYRISTTPPLASTQGGNERGTRLEGTCNTFLTPRSTLDSQKNCSNNNNNKLPRLESLLNQAHQQFVSIKQNIDLQNNREDQGVSDAQTVLFDILAQAFQLDPTSSKVSGMFMEYFTWKVEVAEHKYHKWKTRRDTSSGCSHHYNNHSHGNEHNRPDSSSNDDLHYNNNNNNDKRVRNIVEDGELIFSEKEMNEFFQDKVGLSSLYIDREQYDLAGKQLRTAIDEATYWITCSSFSHESQQPPERQRSSSQHQEVKTDDSSSSRSQHWQYQIDRARYLLYRTNAACCQWGSFFEDGDRLRQSLLLHYRNQRRVAAVHVNSTSSSSTRWSSSSGIEPQLPVQLLVHPFDALKFPSISLELASAIAKSYANRSLKAMGVIMDDDNKTIEPRLPRTIVTVDRHETQHRRRKFQQREKKIRIGYISPDFTSRHPLAFLMQNVFACHDKSQFVVYIYSLSSPDDGQEVKAIIESSDQFTYFSPSAMSPMEMYHMILRDELDILVDLCGYAGTSIISELMASRCRLRQDEQERFRRGNLDQRRRFPIHVSYMGFPGSIGSSIIWDYSVFDKVVIPIESEHRHIRCNYEEALVYMPHSYFVNSHKSAIGGKGDGIMLMNEDERKSLRRKYGIPPSAFVYCCHSRPDKIDPTTFRSWMRALSRVWSEYQLSLSGDINENKVTFPAAVDDAACSGDLQAHPVLWLLRSGNEMENNIRSLVKEEFGEAIEENCLIFADIAERREHLHRLGIADLFLDTPSYGAHTLGCDALYMGVPMVSLLRDDDGAQNDASSSINVDIQQDARSIATNKLASRVGASLLKAVGLNELVYSDVAKYENAMVKCALDKEWFDTVRQQFLSSKDKSPLFDTGRWMQNLEAAFASMVEQDSEYVDLPDIVILDQSE